MTPEEMEHERLAGPRMLTFTMLWSLAVAVALFLGFCGPKAFAASPYQACEQTPSTTGLHIVYIYPSTDAAPWKAAIAEWDAHYPGTFAEGSFDDATVLIAWTPGRTWVDMPCHGHRGIVYVGRDADLSYWAAHELGHAGFALRDWIRVGQPKDGYINPGTCPAGYDGIMSYCTPRERWWGADDDRVMRGPL